MSSSVPTRSELILVYHSVTQRPVEVADPCFVDADTFREQMLHLRARFDVVRLTELVAGLGHRRERAVAAVTFDDGFLNNAKVALPILQELGIPATVFLCTDLIDSDRTMWFCELNRALASTDVPKLAWRGMELDLSTADGRARASLDMQAELKMGTPAELHAELESLLDQLGDSRSEQIAVDSPYRMLTSEAVAEMAESGIIDFGAHTQTHPILSRLPADEQEREISESIRAAEQLSGRRCSSFAYPNGMPGDYDASTLDILERSGIEIAVTALPGTNNGPTARLELHRQGYSADFAVPRWATTIERKVPARLGAEPIRLLFTYPFFGLGGVETATLAKIDALERAGIEAWAYFHQPYGTGGGAFTAHPRVMVGLEDEATLAALLNQDWDAICLIDYTALLPVLDKYAIEPEVIFESHAGLTSFQDRVYPKLSHPRIRTIVLPSRANADRVRDTVGPAAPIVTIPNAVDPITFDPAVPGIDPGIGLADDEKPIVWIGRLEDEKNPQELIAVTEALLAAGEHVHVVIVGDLPGQYEARVAELRAIATARARGAMDFVQGVPHSSMADLYRWVAQRGGLLLSTSRYETQPMIFLEAMAAGCPVVSSDVGSIRELIQDGTNGRVYPLGDVDVVVRVVREVLARGPETVAMIASARERVVTEYSPDAVARLYRELMEGLGIPGARRRPGQAAETRLDGPANAGDEIAGLVSTIIPLHDRPGLLRQAIASVQAQTYPQVEIVLADDGSADQTAALCDRLAALDPRIRVVHLEHIGLAGPVREAGRQAARGEFIQYLDSDDLLTPRKFEVMVAALHEQPDRDIAYCLTRRYTLGDRRVDVPAERTGEAHSEMLPSFLSQRYWHASTPVYRRRVTDLAGPWTDLRAWEDIEYDMRIASHRPRLAYCPEYLVEVRDHASARLSRQYWYNDPFLLSEAIRASGLVHEHALRGGMTIANDEMHDLLEDVRFVAFHCQRLGLDEHGARATTLMGKIAGGEPAGPIAMPRLDVEITSLRDFVVANPGETVALPVGVLNRSSITLRHGLLPIGLSYHLLDTKGQPLAWDNARVFFSPPLGRGEERVIPLPVTAPAERGGYTLELDVVWESVTWFKDAGSKTANVRLVVGAPDPVEEPLVSVVIPAFNQAAFLPEAVESVRWQTHSNWECIIVDDGSTDRTGVVARALAAQDPRVRYHYQPNKGLSAARNAGLALSEGTYVQFLDADDVIAPSKLRRHVTLMETDPTLGVSYSNFWRFDDATGDPLDRSPARLGSRPLEDFLFLWERGLTIPVHAAVFRRALWSDRPAFDTRLRGREDWLMWIDLAVRETKMAFIDADLAWYRIHDGNMVHSRAQMIGWLLEAADLIRGRIPAQYRRPFVEETIRHVSATARAHLGAQALGSNPASIDDAVDGLEMIARSLAKSRTDSDSGATTDVVEELRILALACRREGREEAAERCEAALRALTLGLPADHLSLAVTIEPMRKSLSSGPGDETGLLVRVRNDSAVSLRTGTYARFALSYHLMNEEREVVAWDNNRVPFGERLRPGRETILELPIRAPALAGRYIVQLDVVCEGVVWLGETGSPTVELDLAVEVR